MAFRNFEEFNSDFESLSDDYYNDGNVSLNLSTKKKNLDIEISTSFEGKLKPLNFVTKGVYHYDPKNLKFGARFNKNHIFLGHVNISDVFMKNMNHEFNINYDTTSRHRRAEMDHSFSKENWHIGGNFQFVKDFFPIVTLHSTYGYQNYFGGLFSVLDFHRGHLDKQNVVLKFCMGYSVLNAITFRGLISSHGNNMTYNTSVFLKLTDALDLGGELTWCKVNKNIEGSLCGKVEIDPKCQSFMKFKMQGLCDVFSAVYGYNITKGLGLAGSISYKRNSKNTSVGLTINSDLE